MKTPDEKTLNQLSEILRAKKLTIAVAESCTAGLLQNTLSQAEEAMSFFQGGITVYNVGQKAKHLNINPIIAEKNNAVSKDIAEQMALQVAEKFNAELGYSITGFARTIPEEKVETCFAYIALSQNSKIILSKKITGDAEKDLPENQSIYIEKMIGVLLSTVKTGR